MGSMWPPDCSLSNPGLRGRLFFNCVNRKMFKYNYHAPASRCSSPFSSSSSSCISSNPEDGACCQRPVPHAPLISPALCFISSARNGGTVLRCWRRARADAAGSRGSLFHSSSLLPPPSRPNVPLFSMRSHLTASS